MKNIFPFLVMLCIIFGFSIAHAHERSAYFHLAKLNCQSISASFTSSHAASQSMQAVTFTNTSQNYTSCKWYINDSLITTNTNLTYTFNVEAAYEIRLEVYSGVCSATSTRTHDVGVNIPFCGDIIAPDQDPAECACVTNFNIDSIGQLVSETKYRWADRWGNKLCNISIAKDCEDNIQFKGPPISTPPPASCQAGYFNLYFTDQTIGGTLYSIPQAQRNIVCQVFADMSQLITRANPNVTVNIEIKATYDLNSTMLASAGSYYELSLGVNNTIIHGEVWKAINTGANNPALYDGIVNINQAKSFFTNFTTITTFPPQNKFDLYAIIQHELMHVLGFASLITSYGGSSFYSSNNLFSSFDMHLKNNGGNVLTNSGPGMTYTFNSLGNNCTAVRFNNQNGIQSPVNSYQNANGTSTFYSPSHFDDACTNNPGQLYAMNPAIAINQKRRLLQEEVNVLCKMGYVLSNTGYYGTPTLLTTGGSNPNRIQYTSCSGTGTGAHLAAFNDDLTAPYQYYTNTCTTQNPTGTYQINVLGNDVYPNNTSIVDVYCFTPNTGVTATATGFTFSPINPGNFKIIYRLKHTPSGALSNYAVVFITVNGCGTFTCANNCNQYVDPNGCNLICNHEVQKSILLGNAFGWEIPSVVGPIGTGAPNNPAYLFEGWQRLTESSDFISAPWVGFTSFNQGGTLGLNASNSSVTPVTESTGQCVDLQAGSTYLVSLYQKRKVFPQYANSPGFAPAAYNFYLEALNTSNFQVGYLDNFSTVPYWTTPVFPPAISNTVYASPLIPAGTANSEWTQYVTSFTPTEYYNFIYLYGRTVVKNTLSYMHFDNIEILEDDLSAGPDVSIQCGNSTTLQATCMDLTNLNYAWHQVDAAGNTMMPALGVNTNITVSPSATTTYRLVRFIANLGASGNNGYFVENAQSLSAEDDITVSVTLPSGGAGFTHTITNCFTANFVAQNQSGTHQWTFGDGNNSTLVNPSNVYASANTFVVTHTVSELGCTATFTGNVVIALSAIAPTFAPIAPMCIGTNFTLPTTSQNGISGSWSPAFSSAIAGVSTYTFTPNPLNNPTCAPSVQRDITITTCGGCDTTDGIQISGVITNDLLGGSYKVVGDLFISTYVKISNSVLAIEPNITIHVGSFSPDDLLMLEGSHLYGCHTLWNGILLYPNGRLFSTESFPVVQSTLIEDAKIAVDILPIPSPVNTNIADHVKINKTTFNRNMIGIRITGYPYSNTDLAFKLYGNVFSKRKLWTNPTIWPRTHVFSAANPLSNTTNSVNPRINTPLYPESVALLPTLANGNLIPNAGNSSTGIRLVNVGNVVGTVQNALSIGKTSDVDPFVFDGMLNGIDATSSVIDVRHAYFQAPSGFSNASIGIRTNSNTTAAFNGRLLVDGLTKPVQFYNLRRAVDVQNYRLMTVQNTRIRTNRTAGLLFFISEIGDVGIRYQSILSNNVTVTNNIMHNLKIGVDAYLGSPAGSTTPIAADISFNQILKDLTSSPGQTTSIGVRIRRTMGTTGAFSSTLFKTNGNVILDVSAGIEINGLPIPTMEVNNNTIRVRPIGTLVASPAATSWGINLLGATPPASGAPIRTVKGNTITGALATYAAYLQIRGIMLTNSNKFMLSCNSTLNTGAGLYFSSTSQNTIRQNTMSGHRFGLWLESATIGVQGAANMPTENTWTGTWNYANNGTVTVSNGPVRYKTYVSGTTNANASKMFVRNSLTHNPNYAGSASWAKTTNSPAAFNSISSVASAAGIAPSPCAVAAIVLPPDSLELAAANEDFMNALEQTSTEMDSTEMQEALELQREMALYEYLDKEPAFRDSSEALDNFYDERSDENIGLLREMEEAIANNDLVLAAYLRDQVIDDNLVTSAYKTVLNTLLKYENGSFTSSDLDELWYWANTCSYLYGNATVLAQNGYNCIQRESHVFEENCPSNLQKNMQIVQEEKNDDLILTLFPNPTNGYLFVTSNDEKIVSSTCTIRSLDGREIFHGTIDFENGLSLSNLGMATGVYILEFDIEATKEVIHQQFMYFK